MRSLTLRTQQRDELKDRWSRHCGLCLRSNESAAVGTMRKECGGMMSENANQTYTSN